MQKLCLLSNIPLFFYEEGTGITECFGNFDKKENPLGADPHLAPLLIDQCRSNCGPVVITENKAVFFSAVKAGENQYILAGPMCSQYLSNVEVHRFYKLHNMEKIQQKAPARLGFMQMLSLISLIYTSVTGEICDEDTLLRENKLAYVDPEELERDKASFRIGKVEEEAYHHTYMEEMQWINCIKNGDEVRAKEMCDSLAENAGKLSGKELNHQRNLAICAVTLATRAAIESGVTPAEAYILSDVYIDKIDKCSDLGQLIELRRLSTMEFTRQVKEAGKEKARSNYTEQCKDYIINHYQYKIRLVEVADAIGINKNYLSHLFKKEEGISMNEYTNRVRVKRAENLLKYSDATLTEISSYVCFNSQSHFGSVFKKCNGVTPQQYRDRYRSREFTKK